MMKSRKTRKEKIKSHTRHIEASGFMINPDKLVKTKKGRVDAPKLLDLDRKFFKADLTKTLILTMLVLALELALWQYLSKH